MANTVKSVLFFTFLWQSSKSVEKAMEGFVVGGNFTSIREYPHSAFLIPYCDSEWICGAAILNQRILITAGHCVYGCDIKHNNHHIEVLIGSGNLDKVKIKRLIERVAIHEHYIEQTVVNDIALAMLDHSVPFGKNVKRVIIQNIFPMHPKTVFARVAGWGTVDERTGASQKLKHVVQKLRSKQTCAKIGKLTPGMFCAGSEKVFEDRPSQGDSGSALVDSQHTALGLVSFRISQYPALMVYTNVTYYYKWLTNQAQKLFCN